MNRITLEILIAIAFCFSMFGTLMAIIMNISLLTGLFLLIDATLMTSAIVVWKEIKTK